MILISMLIGLKNLDNKADLLFYTLYFLNNYFILISNWIILDLIKLSDPKEYL
jgi:hypothetical protein